MNVSLATLSVLDCACVFSSIAFFQARANGLIRRSLENVSDIPADRKPNGAMLVDSFLQLPLRSGEQWPWGDVAGQLARAGAKVGTLIEHSWRHWRSWNEDVPVTVCKKVTGVANAFTAGEFRG